MPPSRHPYLFHHLVTVASAAIAFVCLLAEENPRKACFHGTEVEREERGKKGGREGGKEETNGGSKRW